MAAKTVAPKPYVSGFCNITLPRTPSYDPHQRCPGCDCAAPGCPCAPPQEDLVTTTDEPTPPDITDDTLTQEQLDRLPTIDVSGTDRIALDPAQIVRAIEGLTPEHGVDVAVAAAEKLNTVLLGYDPDDWREALKLLHQLRKATQTLGALDAGLVQWLYLHGEHGFHQSLDGIGPYGIGRGREKERWEGSQAVNDYVERKLAAIDGEYPDPGQVVEWVLEVVPVTPSTKLRVTPLVQAGLEVAEYRSSEPGTLRVDLPRHPLT